MSSVADPWHFDTDPDPDPAPIFGNTDPGSGSGSYLISLFKLKSLGPQENVKKSVV